MKDFGLRSLEVMTKVQVFLLGVSVAYLSGRPAADGQLTGNYTEDDVDALRALADDPGVVDIFLTYPSS